MLYLRLCVRHKLILKFFKILTCLVNFITELAFYVKKYVENAHQNFLGLCNWTFIHSTNNIPLEKTLNMHFKVDPQRFENCLKVLTAWEGGKNFVFALNRSQFTEVQRVICSGVCTIFFFNGGWIENVFVCFMSSILMLSIKRR